MNEITRNVRLVHIDAAKDQYLLPPRVVLKKLSIEAHKGIWLLLLAMKAYLWCKQYSIKFDISEIETILLETGFLENNELTGRSNKIVSFFVELSRRVEFSAKAEIEGVGFVEFRPSGSEEEVDSAALMRRAERTCIKFLTSLVTEQRIWLWFAIDRTDILFDGDQNLESQSLYALLSILRDDIGSNSADFGFKTKLFLKSEVWSELSKQGIPEFSHLVARRTELIWTLYELQRVIAGRFAANQNLMEAMIYDKSSALKNRYSVEDFMIQLLPEKLIPDRGGGRKPKDWILQTLRDSTGLPTPRDYIQYFRKVIDYERDQVEREGGTGWRHRNLFQQESLIMGGKLLAIEKLHIMVSELPALQPLLDYVKKNARRVLTPENYLEAMGERGREEISRFLSSGILRPMLLNDNCEIPWFFFDALVSRERQMSSGYEVPDAKSSKFKAEIEKTLTTREFIQCVYQKVDGNEVVNYGGKRIRLPTESLLSIRSTIKEGGGAIKFWINVLRQGTWILDSTRPLIIEQTYDFKIGGWNGNDHNLALCVDERLGQELEIAAQGFLVSNVGIVLKGVVADIGQKFPICVPEPIDM